MMRRFSMYRPHAPETHTEFQKNAPDEVQFEGVVFSDGTVAVRWLTHNGSTFIWKCLSDLMDIHGHPEYGSQLVWHDEE